MNAYLCDMMVFLLLYVIQNVRCYDISIIFYLISHNSETIQIVFVFAIGIMAILFEQIKIMNICY